MTAVRGKAGIANTVRLAGAYMAYLIGSGFASGQEIMQFYTGYGRGGVIAVAVSAALFVWAGAMIMRRGHERRGEGARYRPFVEFCGKYVGGALEVFTYVYLFFTVAVMISGAGASLAEYCGLAHYTGSLIMAGLTFFSIISGLRRLVDTIGFIGPVIVVFTIALGAVTLLSGEGIPPSNWAEARIALSSRTPTGDPVTGGLLYASYNIMCGILFFTALGAQVASPREAVLGAALGGTLIPLTILIIDLAFISRISDVARLEIPTLHLASRISPLVGGVFLVILFCGIYSTAAPMCWTVCDRLTPAGASSGRRALTALAVTAAACLCGLLPFGELIAVIYPVSGCMGAVLLACMAWRSIYPLCIRLCRQGRI